MGSNRGFTLLEVLVALVIASLGTVTVGYFVAGVSRLHTESQAISSSTILADTAMEMVVLHKEIQHPDIRQFVSRAARDDVVIKITELAMSESEILSKVTITVSTTDLPKPLILERLVPMESIGATGE